MIWKDVLNYKNIYLVSEYGDIYSHKSKIIRAWAYDKNGYPWITLHGNVKPIKKFIHTIVLEAFKEPRPTPNSVCRHFPDPTVTNVHYTNLMWGTSQENTHDKYYHDSGVTLEKNDVIKIKNEIVNGLTQAEVCRKYNLSRDQIHRIVINKTWKGIGPDISSLNYDKRRILSEKEISQIKYLINNGYNIETIKYNYNISNGVLYRIRDKKNHSNINETNDITFLNNIKLIQQNKKSMVRLSESDKQKMKVLRKQGYSVKQLMSIFNVSKNSVVSHSK